MQANWRMNPRHKVILDATAVICVVGFVLYLGASMWIRVINRGVFRASSQRTPHAEHADLPLFSGCAEVACHKYIAAIELSINRSHDPCQNLYRFVCDGWKDPNHLLSAVDAAEAAMYGRALNAIEWSSEDTGGHRSTGSYALGVAKKKSRWDLLEILLDLSGNWNVHLWFHVSFELAPFRGGTGEPVLRIGHSAAFHAWIATMRMFAGQRAGTAASLRYRRYVRAMLDIFGASEAVRDEVAAKIEAMDRLTLEVLGPAMAEADSRILRTSIRNLTRDVVQVENAGLLRSIVYLLGLKSDVREALTLSLGLRVAYELGWMASREIADVTLELAGLPLSAHWHRCLMQVESTVGTEWVSLFPKRSGVEELTRDVRDILTDVLERHMNTSLQLQPPSAALLRNNASFLETMLPEPRHEARFFLDWLKLMNGRWRLLEQHMTNVLKPGSFLSHRWSFHGALTVAEGYFVFPLFHPDFPMAVNYGGAGRLIADEVVRGLYHNHLYYLNTLGNQKTRKDYVSQSNGSSSEAVDRSPYLVDSKALLASLAAYRLSAARHTSSAYSTESSLAQDRLFFVASCYTLCSSGNYVDVLYGDASHRCNEPVKALPEFSAAFQCASPHAAQ
ncbi:hypothetical protein MTO96_051031 [Rhipicephalus appendiculatus]